MVAWVALFTCVEEADAWEVLRKELTDSTPAHRRQALAVAGSIGAANARAVKLVEDGLSDKDTLVRQTAAAVTPRSILPGWWDAGKP